MTTGAIEAMGKPSAIGIHLSGRIMRRAALHRDGGQRQTLHLEQSGLDDLSHSAGPLDGGDQGASNGEPELPALCIASLPGSDVMSRCWHLPNADPTKLKQIVAHHLEAELPVALNQLVWGFRLGPPSSAADGGRPVLAQAVRADRVNDQMNQLRQAGIWVDTLTTEAEALAAFCRYGLRNVQTAGPEVLILALPTEWLVIILNDGMLQGLRRLPVNAEQLEPACRQCRQFIEAQVPLTTLSRLLWCAADDQAEPRRQLAESLELPVVSAEPADLRVGPSAEPIDSEQLSLFAPAIGLALAAVREPERIIRLAGRERAKDIPRHRRLERLLAHPWRLTAAAVGLLIAALLIRVGTIGSENKRMASLLAEYDRKGSVMARLEPKIKVMDRLDRYRIDVEAITAALCEPIPNGIILTQLELSREHGLTLKGTAKDPKSVFALVEAMLKSSRFDNVIPERVDPSQKNAFTIKAELPNIRKLSTLKRRGRTWR